MDNDIFSIPYANKIDPWIDAINTDVENKYIVKDSSEYKRAIANAYFYYIGKSLRNWLWITF